VSNQGKDKCENLFNIAEYIMFDKPERAQFTVLETVRNMVNSLAGDTSLINDSLYENFSLACQFYDDNFNKTAYLLQCLSRTDLEETFIHRTMDYSLKYL
jgi:ABC-type iron transport system FetAB ATPase subunit